MRQDDCDTHPFYLSLVSLGYLLLDSNPLLTGTIPMELGDLNKLSFLRVFGTEVTGDVPLQVCDLTDTSLTALEVDCGISCTCCDGFCI